MAEQKPEHPPLDLDKLLAPYSRGGAKTGSYTPIDLSPSKLIGDAFRSGHGGVAAGVAGAGFGVYKGVTGYSDAIKTAHKDLIARFKEEQKIAGQVTNRKIAIGRTAPTAPDMTAEGKAQRRVLAKELAKERILDKFGSGDAKRIRVLTTPQVTTNPNPDLRSPNPTMHTNPPQTYDAKKIAALAKEGKLAAGTEAGKLKAALKTAEQLPNLPASWIEKAANNTLFRAASSPWVTRPIRVIDAASNTVDVFGRHAYNDERVASGDITEGGKWGRTATGVGRGVQDFFSLGLGTATGHGYILEEQAAQERAFQEYKEKNAKDPVRYPMVPFNRPYNGNNNIEMIAPNSAEYRAMFLNNLTREGVPNYFASPRNYAGPEYTYTVIDGQVTPMIRPEVAAVREQASLEQFAADKAALRRDRGYFNLDPEQGAIGYRGPTRRNFSFDNYFDDMRTF